MLLRLRLLLLLRLLLRLAGEPLLRLRIFRRLEADLMVTFLLLRRRIFRRLEADLPVTNGGSCSFIYLRETLKKC